MLRGISNFEIQRVLEERSNEDINKNILGIFPSDKINKFICWKK